MKDSSDLPQASVERGYGRCQVFRKNTAIIRKYANGTYVAYSNC